ncbi:hypothetical protein R3I94_002747 [Phoxinus phoxinus]
MKFSVVQEKKLRIRRLHMTQHTSQKKHHALL